MIRILLLPAAVLALLPLVAVAQDNPPAQPRPELFEDLLRCRAMTDATVEARLKCFEDATASLEQATESGDVVVVDRAQVRESRRRLFGIALPHLPVFGGGGGDEQDQIDSVDGLVESASQDGQGHWIIRLQDGAKWVQIDRSALALRPRPGQGVVINRAALGSFMMKVNGQQAIRVKREL